jgi:hypothetical protein
MLYFLLSVLVQNWSLLHLARFYIEPITHMVLKTAPHFSVSHGTIGFHFHLQCWFEVEPCDTWYGSKWNQLHRVPSRLLVPFGTLSHRFYIEPYPVGSKWNQHLTVLFGTVSCRFQMEPTPDGSIWNQVPLRTIMVLCKNLW